MEFRLIYQGPLLASSAEDARVNHKHQIRKKLNNQLRELWNTQHTLAALSTVNQHHYDDPTKTERHWSRLDELAAKYTRFGFRFAPLICSYYGLLCSLDIVFMRRAAPGKLIQAGDIDNRLKTLLDALKMPRYENELPGGAKPEDREDPFFVLLEDDAFVTQMKITTDRLLVPQSDANDEIVPASGQGAGHPESKVYLVIRVRTLVSNPDRTYIEFSL